MKRIARALNEQQLLTEVRKGGPEMVKEYEKYRDTLISMMDEAVESGLYTKGGFFFAVAHLSNEIAKRNNIK